MADAQIYLAGNMDQTTVPRLINEVADRVGKGAKSVLLAISSAGGNVYWGVTAYNFLRGLGVEIITHNLGQVDSIAGVVYCAGEQRFTVTQGRFLIHGVSWTIQAQRAFSEKDLTSTTDALRRDRDTIATILADRTGHPLADVAEDMLQDTVMTAQEGMAYGFAREIRDDVFDPSQEIVRILP